MKECLIGIDSCGTNIKIGAFNKKSEKLFVTKRSNTPIVTKEGYYYFNWRYQKKMIFEMLKEVIDQGYKIISIGTCSCGEAVYPLDSEDNIIDNPIAWYCRRTEEQALEFQKKFLREKFLIFVF